MRHCFSEQIDIYTTEGKPLPDLLRDAAEQIEELEADYSYCMLHTYYDVEIGYIANLYVH